MKLLGNGRVLVIFAALYCGGVAARLPPLVAKREVVDLPPSPSSAHAEAHSEQEHSSTQQQHASGEAGALGGGEEKKKGLEWFKAAVQKETSRIKVGFKGLFQDQREANAISKRLKAPDAAPIAYGEFLTLRRGREDRMKLFRVSLIIAFVPEMLFVMLNWVPGTIPSTFELPDEKEKRLTTYDTLHLKSATGMLQSLRAMALNGKDSKKQEKCINAENYVRRTLSASSIHAAYSVLEPLLFAERSEQELEGGEGKSGEGGEAKKGKKTTKAKAKSLRSVEDLPPPLVKGVGQSLGLTVPFLPAFFMRGTIKKHLERLKEGDAALLNYPLQTLSGDDLREACCARGISVAGRTDHALRSRLHQWLDMCKEEKVGTHRPQLQFVEDRARLALLGINIVSSLRQSKEADLSRQLLQGGY